MKAKSVRNFRSDESGAVAATYALALIPLIAAAGLAMDYSRLMGMDSELQNGADQAALAAATQLDGEPGACERAVNAAVGLLQNNSLLTSDEMVLSISGEPTTCDAEGLVRFYQDQAKTTAATDDDNANFVEVELDVRTVDYALLPITGLVTSPEITGVAFAGVASAICRVPPLMICSPTEDADNPFKADDHIGIGITATGGSNWTPGAFGFLEIGSGQISELAQALAFDQGQFDCQKIDEGTDPETGNAQVLFDAVNTRFDIGFTGSGAGTLTPCTTGSCPPARNVTKDLIKDTTAVNGNACRIHNSGWKLPPVGQRFRPRAYAATDTRLSTFNASGTPLAMGLTRDMCHYYSYNRACTMDNGGYNERFGDGKWAIADYFAKNHPGTAIPAGVSSRYDVYRWEQGQLGTGGALPNPGDGQRSSPLCTPGTSDIDRRILTVAIVSNCAELRGGSRNVKIGEWVDMFLVEPIIDDSTERDNGRLRDMIYMEVVGEAKLGGSAGETSAQGIRKDIPYLLE